MTAHFITIKDVDLNNNCPECYSNSGLHLTFKQQFIEARFYKSITNETSQILHCNTCDMTIYPVNWTDDIERVVAYHQRAFTPKKASFKLNKKAWLLIMAVILLLIFGITLLIFRDRL